jgi:hypothetical protein
MLRTQAQQLRTGVTGSTENSYFERGRLIHRCITIQPNA